MARPLRFELCRLLFEGDLSALDQVPVAPQGRLRRLQFGVEIVSRLLCLLKYLGAVFALALLFSLEVNAHL